VIQKSVYVVHFVGYCLFGIINDSKKMESPKSRRHREKKQSYRRREHKNKKFYNSKAWKETRNSYIRAYQQKIYSEVTKGYWTVSGTRLELSPIQQTAILSLPDPPCELCLKLYAVEAYDKMNPGVELDHIEPINRENALESAKHGDPFSHDNLMLLCKNHHAKKSQRERT